MFLAEKESGQILIYTLNKKILMKHIQTKKIFESENIQEHQDPFEDLYNLSASLIYNLTLYKTKYEANLKVEFDEDEELNTHLYTQIKEVVLNLELLLDSVKSIRSELHL